LKGTINEGLILRPNGRFDIDCYVDADFAGLWSFEDVTDPTCVKSRAGFAICISGCPVVWQSKLIPHICLATMEAEYSALSMSMREVIPFRTLFQSVAQAVGISDDNLTNFNTVIHEDNRGALTLANLPPGQTTSRSKHYALRLHWFRSHVNDRCRVVSIKSEDQQADILTKGLKAAKFVQIRASSFVVGNITLHFPSFSIITFLVALPHFITALCKEGV